METLKLIDSLEELECFMQTEQLEERLEMVQVLFMETSSDSEEARFCQNNTVCNCICLKEGATL